MVKIGVLGAGSWGLGLAMLLHNNGHDVTVWSVFPDEINELNATRENKKCAPAVNSVFHRAVASETERFLSIFFCFRLTFSVKACKMGPGRWRLC